MIPPHSASGSKFHSTPSPKPRDPSSRISLYFFFCSTQDFNLLTPDVFCIYQRTPHDGRGTATQQGPGIPFKCKVTSFQLLALLEYCTFRNKKRIRAHLGKHHASISWGWTRHCTRLTWIGIFRLDIARKFIIRITVNDSPIFQFLWKQVRGFTQRLFDIYPPSTPGVVKKEPTARMLVSTSQSTASGLLAISQLYSMAQGDIQAPTDPKTQHRSLHNNSNMLLSSCEMYTFAQHLSPNGLEWASSNLQLPPSKLALRWAYLFQKAQAPKDIHPNQISPNCFWLPSIAGPSCYL